MTEFGGGFPAKLYYIEGARKAPPKPAAPSVF